MKFRKKKGLMMDRKSQKKFEAIFAPWTEKEVKRDLKMRAKRQKRKLKKKERENKKLQKSVFF